MNLSNIFRIFLFALLAPMPMYASELPIDADFKAPGPMAGLVRVKLQSASNDRLDLYVRHDEKKKPVLVMLPGSGCFPMFQKIKMGEKVGLALTSPMISTAEQSTMNVHLAMLERRGILSFGDAINQEDAAPEKQLAQRPCSAKNGGVTLQDRVDDSLIQLQSIAAQPWAGPILLVGTSEGADVAAAISASAKNISIDGILLIGGAGPTQFYDLLTMQRQSKNREGVVQVFNDYQAFLDKKPPSHYLGYPSARWSSFAIENTPLDNLLKSRMPVFVAHGELDSSVPVSSVDLMVMELMRRQKDRPIYYWAMSGADHSLGTEKGNQLTSVIAEFARWIADKPKGRKFRND